MSNVIKFINNALDEWYKSGKKTSPKGFNLKMLREDGNFDQIEFYYNNPDGPLVDNPDWGMLPIMKANRDETKFGPNKDQLYDTDQISEADQKDIKKVIDLASN